MLHVAGLINRNADVYLIVGGVRKIAAQIMVETRGASGDADDAEVARDCGLEHAGVLQAVNGRGRFRDEMHERNQIPAAVRQ